MNDSRLPLLERHARAYAREELAIVWTAGLDGDDAKRVVTPDWQTTTPLRNSDGGDWAAEKMGKRGQRKNPAVTARTSNLILIDCDTAAGLREIKSLGLPKTWTVQSSTPSKRHFYFRPPLEAAQLPKVGFRFEEDGFTADKNRYLVCPPALHPSGAVYHFLHGPFDGTPIGVMPHDVYQELVRRGDEAEKQLDARLHTTGPGEKVTAGHRRESVFRHACMQRRWGLSAAAITDACMAFNLERCEPPLTRDQVAHQVDGAMRFAGGEELTTAPPAYDGPHRHLDDVVAAFRRYLHLPDATPLLVVLAAVVANRMSEGDPVWVVIIGGSSRGARGAHRARRRSPPEKQRGRGLVRRPMERHRTHTPALERRRLLLARNRMTTRFSPVPFCRMTRFGGRG